MKHNRKKWNDRGVIALTVLWILAILSVLSIGLGRQAELELSLVKHQMEQLKGKYAAWGGVMYAMDKIARDKAADQKNKGDTLYQCGLTFKENETPQILFKEIPVGDTHVDIGFMADLDGDGQKFYYGFQDERSRININLLNSQTAKVLSQLIMLSGSDEQTANTIAFSSIDWRDSDNNLSDNNFGAEDNYYMELERPYHVKGRPFDSVQELLLVRGMTPKIFAKIKDFITVYPKQGNFAINLNTAPDSVLRALARSVASFTNTGPSAAGNVVDKLLSYRRGTDGKEMTADDQRIEQQGLQLSHEEQIILLGMQTFRTSTADMLRINVKAKTQVLARAVNATAIVTRPDLSLVYWYKN